MPVYLDNSATTAVDKTVLKAMLAYHSQKFGNPSSIHCFGQQAMSAVLNARQQAADFLHCQANEIVFTSGATEANNLAIKGAVLARITNDQLQITPKLNAKRQPHIITSAIEHHCVLESCQALEKQGWTQVTYLPVDKSGLVSAAQVKKAIKPNTILITLMYANNEIGTIEPLAEVGKMIKQQNTKYRILNTKHRILFHTDATQAVNYLNCDIRHLGVDLLSLSGHKIYGPKGVGLLYVKKGTSLQRLQDGGAQEFNLRAGTLNTAGIAGLGQALEQVSKNQSQNVKKIKALRAKLLTGILQIKGARLNGPKNNRLPNNINVSFAGVEGESLLINLDQEGVAVSTASACASRSLEPSHVLLAIGLKPEQCHSAIRISLGKYNTIKEIDYVLKILPEVVKRLRNISGYVQRQSNATF